ATACSSGVMTRTPPAATAMLPLLLDIFDRVDRRADAVVDHRNLDPHRFLAQVLFEALGADSRDAADDEDQAADERREAEVDENRRERAVDVPRDRFDRAANGLLERAREAHAVAGQAGIVGQPEEH